MRRTSIISVAAAAVFFLGDLPMTNVAQAGIFDMMNPSRWFGRNDRDYYYGRGYGPGHWGGYGPGHWGGYGPGHWGGYGPGYWGGYPGGWGYPGYYGYPHHVAPATGTTQQQPPPRLPE